MTTSGSCRVRRGSDIGIDDFGDVQVNTTRTRGLFRRSHRQDHVEREVQGEPQRLLDDIEHGEIEPSSLSMDRRWKSRRRSRTLMMSSSSSIPSWKRRSTKESLTLNGRSSDQDANTGLGRTIFSEAGITTSYDFMGPDEESGGNADKYMTWISRTDENGEEKSVGFPNHGGIALRRI